MKVPLVIFLCLILLCNHLVDCKGGGGRGGGGRGGKGGQGGKSRGGSKSSGFNWFGLTKSPASKVWNKPLKKPNSSNMISRSYGNQFGRRGIGNNTFLKNNYYGESSSLLTGALMFGLGSSAGKIWGAHEDREWRYTTRSPYFENKLPGSDRTLPAAAVMGAATAFGLATLLPLNVPTGKSLIFCKGGMKIAQDQIMLNGNGKVYTCLDDRIQKSCPKFDDNSTVNLQSIECNRNEEPSTICTSCELTSNSDVVCNSTFEYFDVSSQANRRVLECFSGMYPENLASFIPTTTLAAPVEKELSAEANIHIFLLKLIGMSDVLETTTKPPQKDPHEGLKEGQQPWTPEAMTFPPGIKVPQYEYPFSLEYQLTETVDGETKIIERRPVEESVEQEYLKLHFQHWVPLPPHVAIVPKRESATESS